MSIGNKPGTCPVHSVVILYFGATLVLGMVGCGLPTWNQLMGAKPAQAPVVVPVAPAPRPPAPEPPPPPPPPAPEELIAKFYTFKSADIDDNSLATILTLPSGHEEILSLNLNASRVTSNGLKELSRLSQLLMLDLRNTVIDGSSSGVAVGQATTLEVLRVDGSRWDDASLLALRPLKSLRVLELGRASLSAQGWAEVAAFPELEELSVHGSSLNDEALLLLSRATKLRRQYMNNTGISDAGLAELGRLDSLESLWMNGCNINGSGFRSRDRNSRNFKALQELMIGGCPLNEIGATEISSMKQLRRLDISRMPTIRDKHFIDLIKPLKELTWLQSSSNVGLTGNALAAVAGLNSLEYLGLESCTAIDDRGLENLVKLKNLKQLDLRNTACTPRGVAALKQYFPELDVLATAGVPTE